MLEFFRPDEPKAIATFRELVQSRVGQPVTGLIDKAQEPFSDNNVLVIDVSGSMTDILSGAWFEDFIEGVSAAPPMVSLVDAEVKTTIPLTEVRDWLSKNPLNGSTSLAQPIAELLKRHPKLLLLTDLEGAASIIHLDAQVEAVGVAGEKNAKLFKISH